MADAIGSRLAPAHPDLPKTKTDVITPELARVLYSAKRMTLSLGPEGRPYSAVGDRSYYTWLNGIENNHILLDELAQAGYIKWTDNGRNTFVLTEKGMKTEAPSDILNEEQLASYEKHMLSRVRAWFEKSA
jgi:tRNA U34 5-methylaminomethyl-2-thiouridine-forming methyltransferase MnmC